MKKHKRLILLGSICLMLLLAVIPIITACPAPEEVTPPPEEEVTPPPTPAEPIVHKAICHVSEGVPPHWPFKVFYDTVNKNLAGEYEIRFVGGREVIPNEQQYLALQAGLIDLGSLAESPLSAVFPGVTMVHISLLSTEEERQSGVREMLNEEAMKNGLYYLGRATPGVSFGQCIVLTKGIEINCLDDFKGLSSSASTAAYKAYAEALGMSFTTIPGEEQYSVVERQVTDVLFGSLQSAAFYNVPDVAGGLLDHYWSRPTLGTLVYNLDSWNALPKHIQDGIWASLIEAEPGMDAENARLQEMYGRQTFVDAGVPLITLPGDEGILFVHMMEQAKYEEIRAQNPDLEWKWIKILQIANPDLFDYLREVGCIKD